MTLGVISEDYLRMASSRKATGTIDPKVAAALFVNQEEFRLAFLTERTRLEAAALDTLKEQASRLGMKIVPLSEMVTARKKPGPKPGGPKKTSGSTPTPEKILSALKGSDWVNTVALGKQVGGQVGPAIAKLLTEGKVKKKGERRATSYKLA